MEYVEAKVNLVARTPQEIVAEELEKVKEYMNIHPENGMGHKALNDLLAKEELTHQLEIVDPKHTELKAVLASQLGSTIARTQDRMTDPIYRQASQEAAQLIRTTMSVAMSPDPKTAETFANQGFMTKIDKSFSDPTVRYFRAMRNLTLPPQPPQSIPSPVSM